MPSNSTDDNSALLFIGLIDHFLSRADTQQPGEATAPRIRVQGDQSQSQSQSQQQPVSELLDVRWLT